MVVPVQMTCSAPFDPFGKGVAWWIDLAITRHRWHNSPSGAARGDLVFCAWKGVDGVLRSFQSILGSIEWSTFGMVSLWLQLWLQEDRWAWSHQCKPRNKSPNMDDAKLVLCVRKRD